MESKKEKLLPRCFAEVGQNPGTVILPSEHRLRVSYAGLEVRNQKAFEQDSSGSQYSSSDAEIQASVASEFRPIIVNRHYRQLKDAEMSVPYTRGMVALQRRVLNWNLYSVVVRSCWWVYLYAVLFVLVQRAAYVFLSWLNQELYKMKIEAVLLLYYVVGLTMFVLPPVPGLPVYITGGILHRC